MYAERLGEAHTVLKRALREPPLKDNYMLAYHLGHLQHGRPATTPSAWSFWRKFKRPSRGGNGRRRSPRTATREFRAAVKARKPLVVRGGDLN
mmetsp:Transcript_14405/g.29557  ORF Transcript_14405/g.29557 Transcript_14405/m.29557 type:complete len:93 (-) Transcript_14405:446-724(-)